MKKSASDGGDYFDAETAKRAAATLKVMLATPHKPRVAKGAKKGKL